MLKKSLLFAILLVSITLAVTAFASADEDQTVGINCVEDKEKECFEETAWAAEYKPGGAYRFVDRGNWGTYVNYTLGSYDESVPGRYLTYAGQTNQAGTLKVYDDTTLQDGKYYGTIYVQYVFGQPDSTYKDGYTGSWAGLTEYHLQVADSLDGIPMTRNGNPIPGQFDYSTEFNDKKPSTGWIAIDINGYENSEVYIAAHSVVWWCGTPDPA